jgi:hypothetical protein
LHYGSVIIWQHDSGVKIVFKPNRPILTANPPTALTLLSTSLLPNREEIATIIVNGRRFDDWETGALRWSAAMPASLRDAA